MKLPPDWISQEHRRGDRLICRMPATLLQRASSPLPQSLPLPPSPTRRRNRRPSAQDAAPPEVALHTACWSRWTLPPSDHRDEPPPVRVSTKQGNKETWLTIMHSSGFKHSFSAAPRYTLGLGLYDLNISEEKMCVNCILPWSTMSWTELSMVRSV